MSNHHLGVAGGPTADPETDARLQKMLDAVILPRLERPARQIGPFRGSGLGMDPVGETSTLLIWPSVPDDQRIPAPLRPLWEAMHEGGSVPCELGCVPPADLEDLLRQHELPPFARPSWRAASGFSLWLVWLEQPLQLLGLLTMLEGCGLERRAPRGEGAPLVVGVGPACATAPPLLRPYFDLLIEDPRPEAILPRCASLLGSGCAPATLSSLAEEPGCWGRLEAPPFSGGHPDEPVPEPVERGDLPLAARREALVAPVYPTDLLAPLVESERLPTGTVRTVLRPWAGSERLRRALGLAPGSRLAECCREALAPPAASLELEFAVGLPGETPEDRDRIVTFLKQVAKAAPRGPKQLRVHVSVYADPESSPAPSASTMDSWLLQVVSGLGRRKIPLLLGDGGEAWVAARLQSGDESLAPVVERVHAQGARRPDSALARSADLWHKAMVFEKFRLPESMEDPGPPSETATLPSGALGSTGLEEGLRGPIVPAAEEERGTATSRSRRGGRSTTTRRRDRWQRWQALAPREFEYRIEYSKRGRLRHLGHRELADLLLGACRDAELPLAMAGVVQPRPKLSFGPPLGVGIEGETEVIDLCLTRKVDHLERWLNERLPEGLRVNDALFIPSTVGKGALSRLARAEYQAELPREWAGEDPSALEEIERRLEELRIVRSNAETEGSEGLSGAECMNQLLDIQIHHRLGEGCELEFALDLGHPGAKCKPRDLLSRVLRGLVEDVRVIPLRRTRLLAPGQGMDRRLRTPMEQVRLAHRRLRATAKRCA